MTRSRGEPAPTYIDQLFPFQVALHSADMHLHFDRVGFLSKQLGCYRLNRTVYVHPERYTVFMFAEQRNAECFLKAFEGEWITPEQSRRGNWVPRYTRMLVGFHGS